MKNNLSKGLASLLVVSSFLPIMAFATETTGTTGTTTAVTTTITAPEVKKESKKNANFCAKLSVLNTKLATQIKKIEEKQSISQNARFEKKAKKESDADSKRAISRSSTDSKRLKNWDKIAGKTTTDAQKAAVATYKASILSAVETRRTAVDAAIATYRAGLTPIITADTTAINAATAAFSASVKTAQDEALASCTLGTESSKSINAVYTKKINDARAILKTARKGIETNSPIAALKATRDASIKAAELAFKTTTDAARATLATELKK